MDRFSVTPHMDGSDANHGECECATICWSPTPERTERQDPEEIDGLAAEEF